MAHNQLLISRQHCIFSKFLWLTLSGQDILISWDYSIWLWDRSSPSLSALLSPWHVQNGTSPWRTHRDVPPLILSWICGDSGVCSWPAVDDLSQIYPLYRWCLCIQIQNIPYPCNIQCRECSDRFVNHGHSQELQIISQWSWSHSQGYAPCIRNAFHDSLLLMFRL